MPTIFNTDHIFGIRIIVLKAALALEFLTGFFGDLGLGLRGRFVVEEFFGCVFEKLLRSDRLIPPISDQQGMCYTIRDPHIVNEPFHPLPLLVDNVL